MLGPADAHDAGVYRADEDCPKPADAHDAGVYRAGAECLAQLMLMRLGSMALVRHAWPS